MALLAARSAPVNTASNGCYYPTTVKIDHNRNVWSSCDYDSSFEGGAAQEYSSGGTLMNTYDAGVCPSNLYGCSYAAGGTSFDDGSNGTDTVVALEYQYYVQCNYYCYEYYYTGFDVFTSPSSPPTLIDVYYNGQGGLNIFDVGYMDVDASNIYFTYYGCQSSYPYTCGYGLAEVQNFATSPNVVSLLAPGSLGFWGGVWVNGADTFVSVTDQQNRTITKYPLPFNPTGTVYGPTPTNAFGLGDPVSHGWNASDSLIAAGDAAGWLDRIKTASNSA